MCGIAGLYNLQEREPVSQKYMERMLAPLRHRGPDEAGIYLDNRIGMGHVRLAIIDLASGSQPIHNEDSSLWIVYNGEVFNYPELKADLLKRGHRFYTNTDTEVVLHLYEEKGPSCLDELNGQFAFAIWNAVEGTLFLARDRVGINPLYYTIHNNQLFFASEIKAIFMNSHIPREMDPVGMDQIFTFWTTLPGRTAFKGIQELPPGHYALASNDRLQLKRYWDIPLAQPERQSNWSLTAISENLLELINDSIRMRLRADVPVGSYLSGGLDSAGITTLIRKNFKNHLRTFGIRFEEKAFDESSFQNKMVDFLRTDHTAVQITNAEIGRTFPDIFWYCETPLLRTAPVPLFLLSQAVHENGFKVVLTGEGGDEVFGGYNIFREAKIKRFWAREPESRLRPLLVGKLYPYIFKDNHRGRTFLQSFFRTGLGKIHDPFYSHLIRWHHTGRIKQLFSKELQEEIGDYSPYEELRQSLPSDFDQHDYLSKAQYLEMSLFLTNYLLSSQGDRMAMAHAVEIRPPYLDHRIIEFMGTVSPKWKIMGLNEKYILKKVFSDLLPAEILKRPKQPYRAPISQSLLLQKDKLLQETLSETHIKEARLFEPKKVQVFLKKLTNSREVSEFDNMALAGILSSHIIFQRFVSDFPANPSVNLSSSLTVISPDGVQARKL